MEGNNNIQEDNKQINNKIDENFKKQEENLRQTKDVYKRQDQT